MATERAEIRMEQRDAGRAGGRPDVSWGRLLAVGAGAVVASAIANVLIAQALASLFQVPAAFASPQPGPLASLTVLGVAAGGKLSGFTVDTLVRNVNLFLGWCPP